MKAIDYTNRQFGRLTALSFTGKYKSTSGNNKKRIWLFQCQCGKQVEKLMEKVVKGWVKSCGCLKSTRTPLQRLQHAVFTGGYDDAQLTEEQFLQLSQLNCHLCGAPPSNTAHARHNKALTWKYNGLDRLDNNQGHTLENVKPCCWECNNLRSKTPLPDFLNHIQRIYLHQRKQ